MSRVRYNFTIVTGDMCLIRLSDVKGRLVAFAVVDAEDHQLVRRFRWRRTGTGYVVGRPGDVRLSRVVMRDVPGGMEVDHIDGDLLDNRKGKLRVCTHRQNGYNQRSRRLGYKGIIWDRGKWKAYIGIGGGACRHLGRFDSPKEAARAYNSAARAAFGPFAKLNEVE
uniref:Putative homing endonuclease n=1 Tax=viral metagenome TaxID=1070528 RepID=A0A6M3M2Z2_9ZZZZ